MDKYIRGCLLGKGSFGAAYLATERATGKKYVLKEISLNRMTVGEKKGAMQEADLLKALKHPNIVSYRESFLTAGNLCIVMDYCEQGDLHSILEKRKGLPLSEETILDWFVQICLAIKHVHDRKIVHRDIKLQNIFLASNGLLKLGDFGVSKVLNSTQALATTRVGTPYYLSPEICQSQRYNSKSDVWSAGCVLYELTCNRTAFNGANMRALIGNIVRGNYAPPPSRYSTALRDLIMGMLQTNPQRRFSIHQVLKQPIIRGRIQQFLSRSGLQAEFAHTVIHGQPSPGQLIVQPPPRPPEAARDPLQARALPAFEAQRARADAALQQQQELAQLKSAAEAARQQEELLRAQARARQQRVREQQEALQRAQQAVLEEKRQAELLRQRAREAKHAEQREAMRYLREEFAQRQAQALRNKAAVEADRGNIAIYIPAGPPPPRPDRDDRAGAARRDRNRHVAHGFVVGPADTHSGRTALEPPAVENCVPVMRGGNQNGQERAAIENFPDVKGERRSRGDDELTPEQRRQVYREMREAAERNRRAAIAAGAADRAGGLAAFLGVPPSTRGPSQQMPSTVASTVGCSERTAASGICSNVTWEAPNFSTGTGPEAVKSGVQITDASRAPKSQSFWAMLGTPEAPRPSETTDNAPPPASVPSSPMQTAQPDPQSVQAAAVQHNSREPLESHALRPRQAWEACDELSECPNQPFLERKRKRLEEERAARQAQLKEIHAANWQQLQAAAAANKASVLQQLAAVGADVAVKTGKGGAAKHGGGSGGGHAWEVLPDLQVARSMGTGVCVDGPDTPNKGQVSDAANMDDGNGSEPMQLDWDHCGFSHDQTDSMQHAACFQGARDCVPGADVAQRSQGRERTNTPSSGERQVVEPKPAMMDASGVCALGDTAAVSTLRLPPGCAGSAAASGLCVSEAESPTAQIVEKLPQCNVSAAGATGMGAGMASAEGASCPDTVSPGESQSVACARNLEPSSHSVAQAMHENDVVKSSEQGCASPTLGVHDKGQGQAPVAALPAPQRPGMPEDDPDGQEFAALLQDMAQTVQEERSSISSSARGLERESSSSWRNVSNGQQEGRVTAAQAERPPFCPHQPPADRISGDATSLEGQEEGFTKIREQQRVPTCPHGSLQPSASPVQVNGNSCMHSGQTGQDIRSPETPGRRESKHASAARTGAPGEAPSPGQPTLGDSQVETGGNKDSLAAKAEALRSYLEGEMGVEPFLQLYHYMESFSIEEDPHVAADTILKIVGENVRFIPLVHQLIASEEVILAQSNGPST